MCIRDRPHPEHEVRQDLPVQMEEEREEGLPGGRIEKGRRAGHVDAGDQELPPPEDEFLRADERALAPLDDDGRQGLFETAVRRGRVLAPDEHQAVDGAGADLRGGKVPQEDVFQCGKERFGGGQGWRRHGDLPVLCVQCNQKTAWREDAADGARRQMAQTGKWPEEDVYKRQRVTYNFTLFQYRYHGADFGRVLLGVEVPEERREDFEEFLARVERMGYPHVDETDNPAYKMFLGWHHDN